MTRHGKNCTAGAVYTYHEKQKDTKQSGWGSQQARYSKDSIKDFDYCSLTLQPCKDPVVTKEGHLYEREVILEYILHQKQANNKKMKAYEKQLKKDEKTQTEEKEIAKGEVVTKFLTTEKAIKTKRENPFKSEKSEDQAGPSCNKKNKEEEIKTMNINTNAQEKKNLPSFWIPSLTPQASQSRVEKPDSKVYCPMSGKPIKLKDLISVKFTLAPADESDKQKSIVARKQRYICPVTRDVLSNTVRSAVLKPSGNVVSMECVEKFIKKDWVCPITGQKLKEKDVIELKRGGTGYSSVGKDSLEGKAYGPTMMVS